MRPAKRSRPVSIRVVFVVGATVALLVSPGAAPGVSGDLVPAALRLDLIANDVIEPGEFPLMAPSWSNVSASPITATGTASNFTGPPGASYGFLLTTADYGTIPASSVRSCWEQTGDCYVLAVSDPAQRPALHWDATVLETLSTGETKTWTLHIGRTFGDVSPTGTFYPFIETLVHNEITAGCNTKTPPYYCPKSAVTRAQIAIFLLRGVAGGSYTPPPVGTPTFTDVPASSPYARWIEELVRRGITAGCDTSPPRYCPDDPVTRQELAIFLLRALEGGGYTPPPVGTPSFTDVPASSPYARWIEDLHDRGIVAGCDTNPPRYCPTDAVTREQMSVFLTRTFELVLYGP